MSCPPALSTPREKAVWPITWGNAGEAITDTEMIAASLRTRRAVESAATAAATARTSQTEAAATATARTPPSVSPGTPAAPLNVMAFNLGYYLFQPKTSTFSTRALISAHFKTVREVNI